MFMKKINNEDWAYIAGFLDRDGSLITQIVKDEKYQYKFKIRISIVFYQRTENIWILIWLKSVLKYGSIKKRTDGMSEYIIISANPVKNLLLELIKYLKLKKNLAKLILKIIEDKKNIKSINDFIEICKLVDKTLVLSEFKKRLITTDYVINYLQEKKLL